MPGRTGLGSRQRVALATLGLLGLSAGPALAAYDCVSEAIGEVQGETGSVCAPRCSEGSLECPANVPAGTTAQPQCMLQDVNQVAYCGLLCSLDAQCPSGASCKKVGAASLEVSLCIHPLSFNEWAGKAGARTKLMVGFAAGANAGGKAGQHGFRIAKAFAALQSLKRRYGVAEGDADVLTVKELLQAMSIKGPAGGASATSSLQGLRGSVVGGDMSMGAFTHDVDRFTGYVQKGLPGLEQELHDTMWNLEHLGKRGVCSELLRSLILIGLVYVGIGSFYKYQTMGSRGPEMIPHIGFWMEYPTLVMDGVHYALEVGTELLGGRSASAGMAPRMTAASGGAPNDRDTFAHFEPSK